MKQTLLFTTILALSVFGPAAHAAQPGLTARTALYPAQGYETDPAGSSPGVYITNIATGYSVSGYPCYACVAPGAIGEPQAQYLLSPSKAFTTSIQIQDTTFVGDLTVDFSMSQNSKVVLSGSTVFSGLVGNEAGVINFNGTLPSTAGSTVVLITILNGTTVVGKSKSTVYIK